MGWGVAVEGVGEDRDRKGVASERREASAAVVVVVALVVVMGPPDAAVNRLRSSVVPSSEIQVMVGLQAWERYPGLSLTSELSDGAEDGCVCGVRGGGGAAGAWGGGGGGGMVGGGALSWGRWRNRWWWGR